MTTDENHVLETALEQIVSSNKLIGAVTLEMSVMKNSIDDLRSLVEKSTRVLYEHIKREEEEMGQKNEEMAELKSLIDAVNNKLDGVVGGFPDDDPKTHRDGHVAANDAAKKRAEFWSKMTFEITRAGLLGFCLWAAYALWEAFLKGPKP